jgi:hypothetical protein
MAIVRKENLGLIDKKKIELAIVRARLKDCQDKLQKEYELNQIEVEIELLEHEALQIRERLVELEGEI